MNENVILVKIKVGYNLDETVTKNKIFKVNFF